ncbi:MAG: tRNA (adenosine(37)-N6)-threonylcarbamoyltransferase complex dimerization subunit type 1 TsaB [Nitrospiria bacterium]
MKILAIETSSLSGGVALMDEDRLIAEYRLSVDVRHAERVMVSIDHLLKQSRTSIAELDGIAVSIGPGSFTGLRVGLATAKGLAIGAKKALILVPTLEAMAAAFPFAKPLIVPFIDAKKSEVYWAVFDSGNGPAQPVIKDAAGPPETALECIAALERQGRRNLLFAGDGAVKYREAILDKFPKRTCFPPPALSFPSAACVAEIGLRKCLKGETTPPELAVPVYLRASTAELKWAERRSQSAEVSNP